MIYTFYSFKGGVGRSMALANVAALMAKANYRVLVIDWDLEAPGLEKYFTASPSYLSHTRDQRPGIVDIVYGYANNEPLAWKDCLIEAYPFPNSMPVSILSGGRDSPDYLQRLQDINWEKLFTEKDFGNYLETLREEWLEEFDFILIDSRTGITDIGGICTIHLPDAIVLLFTTNEQSINGVKSVIDRVFERYKTLPVDRSKLLAIPVPSRFETVTENNLFIRWKGIIANTFRDVYQDWIPDGATPADILDKLVIPYIPFWSFGEGLPVVTEGTGNPSSLGFAYELLARLLTNRLNWNLALANGIALSTETSPGLSSETFDAYYDQLPDDSTRYTIRRILLRLINLDPTNPDNDFPKKVAYDDFGPDDRVFVDQLVQAKIVLPGTGGSTKTPTIELAQQAMQNWKRLQKWIKADRDFLLWRQDLHTRALAWEGEGKHRSELLRGAALTKAQNFSKVKPLELDQLEIHYLKDSFNAVRRDRVIRSLVVGAAAVALICAAFVYFLQRTERSAAIPSIDTTSAATAGIDTSAIKGSAHRDTSLASLLSPRLRLMISGIKPVGLDISRWNKVASWDTLTATGVSFVIVKASEGLKQDPTFSENWANAKTHGLIRGAYHYFTLVDKDVETQAANFFRVVNFKKGDLPPILDLDTLEVLRNISLPLLTKISRFLQIMDSTCGRRPIIFLHPENANILSQFGFDKYPLWIGNYGTEEPYVPLNWKTWTFWQFTTNELFPGIEPGRFKVDVDQFNGTLQDLKALTFQ